MQMRDEETYTNSVYVCVPVIVRASMHAAVLLLFLRERKAMRHNTSAVAD